MCKDLEMGKHMVHSGNSEKFDVLVIDEKWQCLPQNRSFSPHPSPQSHAKVQREAVRADMGAEFHEFLRGPGSFQLTTHPWNVVFDLLAQDGGQVPSHHTHTLGTGMEEEGKKKGAKVHVGV